MSRTFLATLQYDGTGFVGWQRQPAGRSVQGEFERVLERLFARRTIAHAAGRTDAGVHAIGQGVSFSAPAGWSHSALHRALNALLPRDCWVAAVHPMHSGFHARKSAISRRYRYDVGLDDESASPFRSRYEWALCRSVDVELLHAATKIIGGEHDFRGFAAKTDKPHYRCRILEANWIERPGNKGISFSIEADRFLQRMVRMLVGTMIDIGTSRRPLTDMAELLDSHDNQNTSAPAPPQGLYFDTVVYPPELFAATDEMHAAAIRNA
ncbi:MAG TPA: tRNA pseudouridine(38-40) synthase TruA [Gemmatimonadales bacterium]|nr:tRNA pseudouridine(38-40) synthase TruA [Gemmatimonadales bacterium]